MYAALRRGYGDRDGGWGYQKSSGHRPFELGHSNRVHHDRGVHHVAHRHGDSPGMAEFHWLLGDELLFRPT